MNKIHKTIVWGFIIISSMFTFRAYAQESELELRMSRDFGYASGRGDIQGIFIMKVSGPENLVKVTFYIDNNKLSEDTEAPYQLRFNTDSYNQGEHTLYALGTTAAGQELRSNEIHANFVSAEEGWKAGLRFAGPLLGLVFGVMILAFVMTFISERKSKNLPPGTPRKYGLSGGAICPRCQRPFAMHFFSPNILVGKFDRCPYCGHWSALRPKSMDELRAAEAAELATSQCQGEVPEESDDEKLRKELDESKFL
jgi:hypothetical protein